MKKNKHGYRGVGTTRSSIRPWSAVVRPLSCGPKKWLGSYKTIEEAARAYDDAAEDLGRGRPNGTERA